MANELLITVKTRFIKGSTDNNLDTEDFAVTVAGEIGDVRKQVVGFAAEEVLDIGDAPVGSYVNIVNRDTTNFVQVRAALAETPFARLLPNGEPSAFRIDATAVLTVQAAVAPCTIEFQIIEP